MHSALRKGLLFTKNTPPFHFLPTGLGLRRAADVDGRRHLRSAYAVSLVVPSTRRATLGDRAFPVAAARAWNDLPPTIRASPSLLTFHQQLKTFPFQSAFH